MDNILRVHLPVSEAPVDLALLEEYEETLRTTGVVVLKNVFTKEHLDQLSEEFDKNWEAVQKKISADTMQKSPGVYLSSGQPKTYTNQPSWNLDDGSVVLDLAKGRLDFTYGMDKGSFVNAKFFNSPLISALMWRLLKCDWTHYCGALPSFSTPNANNQEIMGSEYGPWHRDTYSLFGCEKQDIGLPPFYFTLLTPLQDVTEDLGPTEFVLGSHASSWSAALQEDGKGREHFLATSKLGDCVLFDGRMIHRGTPCCSTQPRRAIYTVLHKKWYADYTDNQISLAASAHGVPRDAVLPSGFQVPVDVFHPCEEYPNWRIIPKVSISKGDIVWRVGQGDSLVFDNKEMLELHLGRLSSLEANEDEEKAYQTPSGKIVFRKDWSSLMPLDSGTLTGNLSLDKEGNWIAIQDLAKDSTMVLFLK